MPKLRWTVLGHSCGCIQLEAQLESPNSFTHISGISEGVTRTPGSWLGLSSSPRSSAVWLKLVYKAIGSQRAKQKLPGSNRSGLRSPEGHLPSLLLVKANPKASPDAKKKNAFHLLMYTSSHKNGEELLGRSVGGHLGKYLPKKLFVKSELLSQ